MIEKLFTKEQTSNPFKTFWMAGYECSDKLNVHGNRVDFLNITGHLKYINEDYQSLSLFNIKTVREGIRWSKVETSPYQYDWSTVAAMMEAAEQNSIQQIWDLCHFGFPDDLTPLHPKFVNRFESLCSSFINFYRSKKPYDTLLIIPINEISFLSWLGGHVACTVPYCKNSGWEVKYNLLKACIKGSKILKQDGNVKILTSEPLVNMVPVENATTEEQLAAIAQHNYQYQVMDALTGSICPELGGAPDLIDVTGVNYYYNNQWITNSEKFLIWKQEPIDARWRPLRSMLTEVSDRYNLPVAITETSHPKEDRPMWIEQIASECKAAIDNNVNLYGICVYPVIDRPDWDDVSTWHRSGVWDIENNITLERKLYQPFAKAILQAQKILINETNVKKFKQSTELAFINN